MTKKASRAALEYRIIVAVKGGEIWSRWLEEDVYQEVFEKVKFPYNGDKHKRFDFPIVRMEKEDSSPEECQVLYSAVQWYRVDSRKTIRI